MDTPGEGLVLELFFDRRYLHVRHRLARPDQRHGGDEADQLVDGVKDLLHGGRPRGVGVVGMGKDPVPDFFVPAALLQDRGTPDGVLADLGEPLVVVVMEEPGDPPDLRVAVVAAGVGAHRRLDAQAVLDQLGILGELIEDRPGVLPGAGHGGRV